MLDIASEKGLTELFSDEVMNGANAEWARKEIAKSRNQDVKRLFLAGFACHHAGMLRSDRNLVEKMFHQGLIKVFGEKEELIGFFKKLVGAGVVLHSNLSLGCELAVQTSHHQRNARLKLFFFAEILN